MARSLKDRTGQRFGSLVAVEFVDRVKGETRWLCECDCGQSTVVFVNNLHSGRTTSCGHNKGKRGHKRVANPGYIAVHARLTRDNGPARAYSCVDCGAPARQWSFDHTADPAPRYDSIGSPYSVDQTKYYPRCCSCHKAFDKKPKVAA